MINLHYCLENKTIYLTDGQHRFQALKKCLKMKRNISKLDCMSTFYLYPNDTEYNIKQKFININKSMPVTDLWTTEELDELERLRIIDLVNHIFDYLTSKYSNYHKTSKYPQRPNFNRII